MCGRFAQFDAVGGLATNRSETLADKPSFRKAFRYRCCSIPADGFYEWQQTEGHKRPYYIRRYDQSPLALAGLWEAWRRGDQTIESFTIITVEANTKLKALHQRMPAILEESKLALWLDPAVTDPERIQSLLQPDHGVLEWYPVSTVVNNPENEGPTLISEVPLTGDST